MMDPDNNPYLRNDEQVFKDLAYCQTFDEDGDLLLIFAHPCLGGWGENRDRVQEASEGSISGEIAENEDEGYVRMLVSSERLGLASQRLKDFLEGRIKIAIEERRAAPQASDTASKFQVYLEAQPSVFAIILNIIYQKSSRVPLVVGILFCMELAKTVRQFQLEEAVSSYSSGWFESLQIITVDALRPSLSKEVFMKMMDLLFICWSFRREADFTRITKAIERSCDERMVVDEIPAVPAEFRPMYELLNFRREIALGHALKGIEDLAKLFASSKYICCKICHLQNQIFLMGSLIEDGLWPRPKAPYSRLSVRVFALATHKLSEDILHRRAQHKEGPCRAADTITQGILSIGMKLVQRLSGSTFKAFQDDTDYLRSRR